MFNESITICDNCNLRDCYSLDIHRSSRIKKKINGIWVNLEVNLSKESDENKMSFISIHVPKNANKSTALTINLDI